MLQRTKECRSPSPEFGCLGFKLTPQLFLGVLFFWFYIGVIWSYIGVLLGLYWDGGKENGSYYLGLRVQALGLWRGGGTESRCFVTASTGLCRK